MNGRGAGEREMIAMVVANGIEWREREMNKEEGGEGRGGEGSPTSFGS